MTAPASILVLPGLDGTGRLLGDFAAALPAVRAPVVLSYPSDEPLGYRELTEIVNAARPSGAPVVMVAESFSGPLALFAASRRPEGIAGIVLVATFIRSPVPLGALMSRIASKTLLRVALRGPLIRHFLAGHDAPAALVDGFAAAVASVRPEVILARVRAVIGVDAAAELRACRAPITYLAGTKDRLVGAGARQALLALRPDVPVVSIDAPHLVLQRQPAAAARAVADFCERVTGG